MKKKKKTTALTGDEMEQPIKKIATPDETAPLTGQEPAELETTTAPQDTAGNSAATAGEVDWKDKFLRAKADFQNLQRRAAEEQRAATRYANADFARALLDVVDDFERTLEAAASSGAAQEDDSLMSGIKLIYDKLLKVLEQQQIEVIETVGRPFDPNFQEALLQQPDEERPPNTVIQEVRKGYKLHDRVLRPARVIVSQALGPVVDGQHADAEQA